MSITKARALKPKKLITGPTKGRRSTKEQETIEKLQ